MKFVRLVLLAAIAACAHVPTQETTRGASAERAAEESDAQAPASEAPGDSPKAPPSAMSTSQVDLGLELALFDESRAALKSSDYATARAKAAEAVTALLARPESEQDAAWLRALDFSGRAAWEAQDARVANEAWRRVLEVRSRTLPDDHPELQEARQDLAVSLAVLGDLAGARTLQERVLEVESRTLPDDHPHLQTARMNLAGTMDALGDLTGARALLEKVLEVDTRTRPDDDPDLQAARQNLAQILRELGDLAGARALFEVVLEVDTRTLPDDHPDLQFARANLALTIAALGDLAGARAFQEKVLEVRSRTLPDDHPDLQAARLNLAVTIEALGDLEGARALLEKVLEVDTRTLPDDHPSLQGARADLALTVRALGDVAGARALLEKVLEVCSRTLPEDHPDLQAARMNLAITLEALGDLVSARALEERVLEVDSGALPDDHPHLQTARLNLAVTLKALGDLAGARALEEKALEVWSHTLPDDHPDLQMARSNLATTMYALGDVAAARSLLEKVLEVRSRTLPDDHPELQRTRDNLAWTIARQAVTSARASGGEGEKEQAREEGRKRCAGLVLALCRSQSNAARSALLSGSSREAEERCAGLAESLGTALSFAAGYGVFEPCPDLARASFELGEGTRGAALASARLRRVSASSPGYAELRGRVRQAADDLALLARKGANGDEFQQAIARRDLAERELLGLAREIAGPSAMSLEIDSARLAGRLGDRAAAIGFYRYPRWTMESIADRGASDAATIRERTVESLCALVLRKADAAGSPALLTQVDLGPIEPIEAAVRAWRASLGVALDSRGVAVSGVPRLPGGSRERGTELRRLVFDPLLPALADVDRVVVALDDVLHLVPLEALPAEDVAASDGLLGDRWRIETRVALSELLVDPDPIAPGGGLVALGGVKYGGAEGGLASADEQRGILRGGVWSAGFADLPETELEVEGIARQAPPASGASPEVVLLTRDAATRERLFELAPKARWLHVATHGWFASESIRSWSDPEPLDKKSGLGLRASGEQQVKGMRPMLLCGLALAGANLPENEFGRVPGLVTAEEISALDLSGCELAVLSACDTNVGERRAGQGVASLQKALQMAGARSVITSLWKVPDEATKELMLEFYRRIWVEKEPKGRALWEAKKRLREARDESGGPRYTTRDWAAWVLTGEPD